MIDEGATAPSFTLPDQDGEPAFGPDGRVQRAVAPREHDDAVLARLAARKGSA
jgi:hypothetical protein